MKLFLNGLVCLLLCVSCNQFREKACCVSRDSKITIDHRFKISELLSKYNKNVDSAFQYGLSKEFLIQIESDSSLCVRTMLFLPPPLKMREVGWKPPIPKNSEKIKLHDDKYLFEGRAHSIDSVDLILSALKWSDQLGSQSKNMCIEAYGEEEAFGKFKSNILMRCNELARINEHGLDKVNACNCLDKAKLFLSRQIQFFRLLLQVYNF